VSVDYGSLALWGGRVAHDLRFTSRGLVATPDRTHSRHRQTRKPASTLLPASTPPPASSRSPADPEGTLRLECADKRDPLVTTNATDLRT